MKNSFSHSIGRVNDQYFLALLERHVSQLTVRGSKARGLCPLHPDRSPSFTADLQKLVWYCFPCGRGGGTKDFALAVGESWGESRLPAYERRRFAAQARLREAEATARAILQSQKDEKADSLWREWCKADSLADNAAALLRIFSRYPRLAEEFPHLVQQAEGEYGVAVSQKATLEAQAAGEVA